MRWKVRYHRPIVDPDRPGVVLFPSGTIIDDLSKVPSAQHDRLIVLEDEPAAAAPVEEEAPRRQTTTRRTLAAEKE